MIEFVGWARVQKRHVDGMDLLHPGWRLKTDGDRKTREVAWV